MSILITGRGIISALGNGIEQNWNSAVSGSVPSYFDNHVANELREQIALRNVGSLSERDKAYELGKTALLECVETSGLSPEELSSSSLVLANTCPDTDKIHEEAVRLNTVKHAKPDTVYRTMMGYVAAKLSKRFKLRGMVVPVSSACSGSALALHLGYTLVSNGVVDRCICGGTERVSAQIYGAFAGMKSVLTHEYEEEDLVQPFGSRRSGIVLGEGSGFVLLESEASAARRNACVFGCMNNSVYQNVPEAPWGDIPDKSIWQNIIKKAIGDTVPDYIVGHATSTSYGDLIEGSALAELFPDVGIASYKALFGHTLSASSIVDTIMLTRCFETQTIIGTGGGNYQLDERLSDLKLIRRSRSARVNSAIKLTAGFGGGMSCQQFSKA